MANTIRIKRSAVQGKVPAVGDLSLGELAVNTYDGKLYTLKNDGTASVVEIGASSGANFSTDISLQNQAATRYYEASANGTNYIAVRAPAALSANITLTLPTTDGDPDQVLGTDGNGNLSWVSRVSGSGTTGDFLVSSTASEQSGYFGNIYLKDDTNTSHYLEITNSADLTALRTLSVNVNDANRTVSLSGNLTVSASATISGTNTGDQTITLTGDVTGSGTGSFATTIANDAITYAKIQNVSATDRLLGRSSAGAGDIEEITCTAAGRALLDDADAAAQRTTLGLGTIATQASSNVSITGGSITGITQLSVSGTDQNIIANETGTTGAWRARILSKNSGADKASFLGVYSSTSPGVFAHNHALNAWEKLYVNTTNGTSDGSDVVIAGSGNVGIGVVSPSYKLEVNGSFAAVTKSFIIPHPTREGMKLRYGSLEGPENGVYARGKSNGFVIELPDYWTKLVDSDSITVSLTPIGKTQTLWVKDIKDNKVYVGSKCSEVNYFYTVFAERADVEKLEVEI